MMTEVDKGKAEFIISTALDRFSARSATFWLFKMIT